MINILRFIYHRTLDANGVNTCLLRGQITTLKAGGGAKILMVPHVSVILPYYEGEKWLLQSVGSVLSQDNISLR